MSSLRDTMGNWILKNDRDILHLSNRAFQRLEKRLVKLIKEKNIGSVVLLKFIENLDQDLYGGGMIYEDINIFNDHSRDLCLLINLVKDANNQLIKENYFDESVKQRIDPFIVELEKYYEEIKKSSK